MHWHGWQVLEEVLSDGAVLSSGEMGCFLSHLTAWQSVVRGSLPFAVRQL